MTIDGKLCAALFAALLLAGCGGDDGRIGLSDNPSQRGIDADFSASLDHGPTSGRPGMMSSEEPVGVFPWQVNNSGQQ